MYNIAVVSKKNWEVLSNTKTNEVSLDGASVVQIGMDTDKVEKFERIGNDLVVTLLNGNTITIEQFFNNRDTADNSVVFQNSEGDLYLLGYTHEAGVTKFVEYTAIDSIQPLLYLDGDSAAGGILPWLFPLVAGGAVAAYTSDKDDDKKDDDKKDDDKKDDDKKDDDKKDDDKDNESKHKLEVGVDEKNEVISGNTTPNSTVKIYDAAGKLLEETVAGEDGAFEVKLKQPLKDGEQVKVVAESKDGEVAEVSLEGYVEAPVVTAMVEIQDGGESVDVSFTKTPYGADNKPLSPEQILDMLKVYAVDEDGRLDKSKTVGQLKLSEASDSSNAYKFDIELNEGVKGFAVGFKEAFYDQDGRAGDDKTNIYLKDTVVNRSVEASDSAAAEVALNDFEDSEVVGPNLIVDTEKTSNEMYTKDSSGLPADNASVDVSYDVVKDLLDPNPNMIG